MSSSYATKKPKPCKKRSGKSSTPTRFCKVCFEKIEETSWSSLFGFDGCVCRKCYQKMAPAFTSFKTEGVPSLALYFYNEEITSILFQFKGCFDIELAPVFLGRALPLLKAKYRGYTLLPAPSSSSHDERRGFNHVAEMFKGLGLPILQAFRKTEDVKQADLSAKERKNVKKRIAWNKGISIRGKKVLLVDDVYTTGSTMKACLALAKKHHPKKVSILVMAKTPPLKRQGKKKGEAG